MEILGDFFESYLYQVNLQVLSAEANIHSNTEIKVVVGKDSLRSIRNDLRSVRYLFEA